MWPACALLTDSSISLGFPVLVCNMSTSKISLEHRDVSDRHVEEKQLAVEGTQESLHRIYNVWTGKWFSPMRARYCMFVA